jgi:hypothetical protein
MVKLWVVAVLAEPQAVELEQRVVQHLTYYLTYYSPTHQARLLLEVAAAAAVAKLGHMVFLEAAVAALAVVLEA